MTNITVHLREATTSSVNPVITLTLHRFYNATVVIAESVVAISTHNDIFGDFFPLSNVLSVVSERES